MGRQRRAMVLRSLGALGAVALAVRPARAENNVAPALAAARAQRIVCIGGALTEMVYALRAEAALVGVDTTSLYPEAARALPSVGYARALSVEGVLSLSPTVVLATEDAGPPSALRQLDAAGVPVTVLPANHRFEGMLDRLTKIGAAIGRTAEAAHLAQTLRTDWLEARSQVSAHRARRKSRVGPNRNGEPLRVMFVLSHSINQTMVGGDGTAAQAMIAYAGCSNALDGVTGYKPLTPESAIAAAPDVILVTDQGMKVAGNVDRLLQLPGLGDTLAGRMKRVVSMEAMLLLGFGPRMPLALRQLDSALALAVPA